MKENGMWVGGRVSHWGGEMWCGKWFACREVLRFLMGSCVMPFGFFVCIEPVMGFIQGLAPPLLNFFLEIIVLEGRLHMKDCIYPSFASVSTCTDQHSGSCIVQNQRLGQKNGWKFHNGEIALMSTFWDA